MRPHIVGVTGTHSTGKSTFCRELKLILEEKGVKVATIPSFGTLAVKQGIPLLTQHTYNSTMWFIERTLEAQQSACSVAEVVLVDRPIIDALAYWNAAVEYRGTPASDSEVGTVRARVSSKLPEYSAIVATRLDSSIELGPGRDTNLAFRQSVDTHLHQILNSYAIHHHQLSPRVKDALLSSLSTDILKQLGHQ